MAKEVGKNTENANTEEERCFQRDEDKKEKKTDQLIKKMMDAEKTGCGVKIKMDFPRQIKKHFPHHQ